MITYLNDDSFFTNIHIPGQLGWLTISKWIEGKNVPNFRFIHDEESDSNFLSLKEKLEIYPGIKTFSMVINPWARALLCYDSLSKIDTPFLKYFDFTNFESFVLSWPDTQFENYWFKLSTPQIDWLEFTDDTGQLHTVDYIFRFENIDEEFNSFKSYFRQEDSSLVILDQYPDYKNVFSSEMKTKIESMFHKDIERFGYKF